MQFYSEKLDKLFKTQEALVEAEAAVEKAAKEKEAATRARKEEATKVEEAFKAYNAAKTTFNANMIARRKKYAEDLAALKKTFDEAVEAQTKALNEAAVAFDTALKEFTAKHGSYHMTLRDGDNVISLHSNGNVNADNDIKQLLSDKWFDSFFNLFN